MFSLEPALKGRPAAGPEPEPLDQSVRTSTSRLSQSGRLSWAGAKERGESLNLSLSLSLSLSGGAGAGNESGDEPASGVALACKISASIFVTVSNYPRDSSDTRSCRTRAGKPGRRIPLRGARCESEEGGRVALVG